MTIWRYLWLSRSNPQIGLSSPEGPNFGAKLNEINPTHMVRFKLNRGEVCIPFCYHEAAVDLLSHDDLNPVGKIPEFKNCADSIDAACQNGIH
jgi:formate dehydrogenase major subunit